MCDAPLVADWQQCEQLAVLAGVDAHGAGVGATRVQRLARAERYAGDDATLALLLHCGHTNTTWHHGQHVGTEAQL